MTASPVMNGTKTTAWQMAADDVGSVILSDNAHYERARFVAGLQATDFPPGNWRGVYRAVCELKDTGKPLHDTFIMEHVPGLEISWLAQRMALADELRKGIVFDENVKMLKRRGGEYAVYEAMRISQQELLAEKSDIETAIGRVLQAAALGNRTEAGLETAEAHIAEFVTYLNSPSIPAPYSGIEWLDRHSNGFQLGRTWMIGGAYKQRKTTLALNIALGILFRNPSASVAFLSFEMPRRSVIAALIAQVAAYHYRKTGGSLAAPVGTFLSMDNLINGRSAYKRWPHDLPAAIDYAIGLYGVLKSRFRIYDVSYESGALVDLTSLQRNVLRDKALYGGEYFIIDHLQEVRSPGNDYERVSAVASTISHLSKRENITTFTLSQLNEQTVKSTSDDEHSPGAKGGGTPAEKADYFVRVRYHPDHPDQLAVKMQLSRYGAMGNETKELLNIHPASGLLLDNQWGKLS